MRNSMVLLTGVSLVVYGCETIPAVGQTQLPQVTIPAPTQTQAKRRRAPATPPRADQQATQQPPTTEPVSQNGDEARNVEVAPGTQVGGGLGTGGPSRGIGPGYTRSTTQAGTKTGTPTFEVPATINVVPQELLQERQPVDLARALETIPGVSIGYGGGFSNSGRARIRGFSNISNFKDGFRQNTVTTEIDLANVEAIEVLKGPASALFGRFEPGGIINFVTKSPTERRFIETWNSFGSNGFFRSQLDAGGALNDSKTVLGRFNAAFERSNGFRDFTDYDKIFLAPAIAFRPNSDTTITFKGEYLRNDQAFDRGLPNLPLSFSLPITRNYGENWMRADKDGLSGSVELLRRLNNDWHFRLAANSSKTDVTEAFFNYGSGFPSVVLTPTGNINRRFVKGTETMVDRSVQAELLGEFATGPVRHKLLIGSEYNYDLWSYDLRRTANMPINAYNPVYGANPPDSAYVPSSIGTYKSEVASLYVQDEMALGPIRVLLGGRFDRTKGFSEDVFFGPYPGVSGTFDTFSPRAGVTYLLTPELSVYGSWAQSTRLELDMGTLAVGGLPEPTKGEQYEVGLKGRFMNGLFQPTISLFDLKKDNAIVFDPNALGGLGGNVQVGQIRSKGVEVELAMQPIKPWKLIAGYTYQEAYISKDLDQALIGNELQNVPKHLASLWTTYNFGTESNGLTLGGGVFYSGTRPTTNANVVWIPEYTRIDLYAAYRFNPKTQISLNINNVTDEQYYVGTGFGLIQPQPPRQFLVTLNHKFE